MPLKWDQSERSQFFRYKVTAVFVRGLFSKGVVEVRGSKLQIRCRLILLISEHPIQRGIRKECWHRIPGNGTEFLEKWRSLRKKVSLTPKKVKMRGPKKSLSPIPSGNGLFAKNHIKIGLIWPLQLHFWSTGAYRGFPPYAYANAIKDSRVQEP